MRTPARTGLTALAISATLVLGTAMAYADGDPTPPPTQQQVDKAQQDVAAKKQGVAGIQASLSSAHAALDKAGAKAEMAAEKYNEARWKLDQAKTAYVAAQTAAAAADQAVAEQKSGIARLVVQNFRGGPQVDQLSLMLDAGAQSDILESYGAVHSASTSMDAAYERYRASLATARVERAKAATAKAAAKTLTVTARTAQQKAAAEEQNASARSAGLEATAARLTRELAKAQGVSVALARKRQDALEQQAAAAAAAQQAAAEAAAAQQAAAQQAAAEAAAAAAPKPSATPTAQPSDDPTTDPSDDPTTPAPTTDPAPAPSGGAAAAIDFAKQQLGEPYKWAAAGPSSWDCSGLMMMAWKAAGVSLPHYSAGQYAATTHITRAQLQPGDLIFWGGSPGSIHHVAMYIGDNMMIHAPRTGQDVMIASVDYWIPPNYFGRP